MNNVVLVHGAFVDGSGWEGICKIRCALRRWFASHRFRHLGVAAILLSAFPLSGCRKPAQPVTITFFDSDFRGIPGDHRMIPDADLQEFTRETGIRVNDLPTPEDNGSKLDLAMTLLRSGAPPLTSMALT
jgi:hypothetical protein